MSKYLGLFVQESTEHLEGFGHDLVELEKSGHRPESVDSLFRHAHSVKGMAASMGFDAIATLAHRAEDLVALLRSRPEALTRTAVDLLLEAGDRMLEGVKLAQRGEAAALDLALVEKIAALVAALTADAKVLGADPAKVLDASQAKVPDSSQAKVPDPSQAKVPEVAAAPIAAAPEAEVAPRLRVEATIVESCPTPGVRAFLVHKKLGGLGTILEATPTLEDCKAGRIPGGRLAVVLQTTHSAEAIGRTLAQIAELTAVSVAAVVDASPPPPAPLVSAAPIAPSKPSAAGDGKAASTVRVRTEQLDGFLDLVGELLLATARLREAGRAIPEAHRGEVVDGVDALHRLVKELHGQVMQVRMTPMALVVDRLPRLARDVARQLGKEVEVELEGVEIELDRAILEELADPLVHLVRNAIDHGLEAPNERAAAGKPPRGKLTLKARRDRDRVVLEISDDGRGMDAGKLRQAAIDRGLLSAEQARALGDREALLLCCLPGLSTASRVSDVSGRGVGMDTVKRVVEQLGGTLEIEAIRGHGTRFTLRLPLTVAVVQVLLVGVGDEIYGLPIAKVVGAVEVVDEQRTRSLGALLLPFGGELVPVHPLAGLLAVTGQPGALLPHVLVEGDTGRFALQVDRLLGQQETVLKPVPPPLERIAGLAGVTLLGTGRPVFLLDVPRLLAGG